MTMHVVGPNEVIDLATLNLNVMQYCIIIIMMALPKIGAHYSLYSSQNYSQRPTYSMLRLHLAVHVLRNHIYEQR